MLFCGVPPALSLTRCSKKMIQEVFFEEYDSRNIFRKEKNTLVEYNNRGYNYNQNTRRRKNKAKINENYIEPENHRASNRFTRRQNNSQLQSQNKNYRRQDGFNKINRELKSKNKYSVREVFSNVCCSVSMNHVLLSRTCLVERIFIFRLQFSVNFNPKTEETLVKEI
jgi:hypothetical protein